MPQLSWLMHQAMAHIYASHVGILESSISQQQMRADSAIDAGFGMQDGKRSASTIKPLTHAEMQKTRTMQKVKIYDRRTNKSSTHVQ